MPFHRAVDPGVEDDQAEQGQECREEEVHVLLVDLDVRRSFQRKTATMIFFTLAYIGSSERATLSFPSLVISNILGRLYTVLRLLS